MAEPTDANDLVVLPEEEFLKILLDIRYISFHCGCDCTSPFVLHRFNSMFIDCGFSNRQGEAIAELKMPRIQSQDGVTLLHIGARLKCTDEVFVKLLDADVPVNAKDKSNRTALHEAVTSGMLSVCKLLIARGAIVDSKDDARCMPLDDSICYGNIEVFTWLLNQHGEGRVRWKTTTFQSVMNTDLDAAISYLDEFAIERDYYHNG